MFKKEEERLRHELYAQDVEIYEVPRELLGKVIYDVLINVDYHNYTLQYNHFNASLTITNHGEMCIEFKKLEHAKDIIEECAKRCIEIIIEEGSIYERKTNS